MKGINNLLGLVLEHNLNCFGHTVYPLFDFSNMQGEHILNGNHQAIPTGTSLLLGETNISDPAGKTLKRHIVNGQASAGSDGSVKNGTGGYTFYISNNSFTHAIWGHALTVGSKREMT